MQVMGGKYQSLEKQQLDPLPFLSNELGIGSRMPQKKNICSFVGFESVMLLWAGVQASGVEGMAYSRSLSIELRMGERQAQNPDKTLSICTMVATQLANCSFALHYSVCACFFQEKKIDYLYSVGQKHH